MPNAIEAKIKDRIQAFVTELDVLVRRSTLDALRSVLDRETAPVRRGPGRPASAGRPKGSTLVEGASDAILAYLRTNDGQGVREIAAATGIAVKVVKKVAIQMLASGAIKKSGVRRGTKYHVGSGKAPAKKAKRAKRGKGRGKKAKAA